MKGNYFVKVMAMAVLSAFLLAGCGKSASVVSMDLSVLQTEISGLSVPENVEVVALGEAGHGVKEYQQMKAEVFKALVNNNGCRAFVIEGDFGGALKVDDYIHGGAGTAEEIVKEIGFRIYNTREMAELLDWMRTYNESASEGEDLHFYGMDMQRYDNNKEYLFSALDQAAPQLSEKYKKAFSKLTDEKRLELSTGTLKQAKKDAQELLNEMDAAQKDMVGIVGQEAFDLARECANTIYMCSDVMASSNYNKVRDSYMFEKVKWFMQHEEGLLFINGHNGHMGKKSVADYTCLGELIYKSIGEDYFAIGTDAMRTEFNSQGNDGEFSVMEVTNQNDLNLQCGNLDNGFYYIDFSKVVDEEIQKILSGRQRITTLNVGIEKWQKLLKMFYTTTIVPEETFDGMIVFEKVSPTTLLE